MTDPTPHARRSPMEHERDATSWTLTDQVAIILKSYGLDDPEAARAVVALALGEAVKVARTHFVDAGVTAKREHDAAKEIATAIRAMTPEAKP